ncbi:MAG: hypothetical protein RID96_13790 [Nitratireductor sp.]
MSRSRSLRRRIISSMLNSSIDSATSRLASARMVGLISSRRPENAHRHRRPLKIGCFAVIPADFQL